MPNLTIQQYESTLKLAGALAQAASRVINSNTKNLSWNVSEMEAVLDAYNRWILHLSFDVANDVIGKVTAKLTTHPYAIGDEVPLSMYDPKTETYLTSDGYWLLDKELEIFQK